MNKHVIKNALFILPVFILIDFMNFEKQTQMDIFITFPLRFIPCVLSLAFLSSTVLFYIHTVLEMVMMESEIRIRIGKQYHRWIRKNSILSCILICIIVMVYGLAASFSIYEILLSAGMQMLGYAFFLMTVKWIKKERFAYVFLVNIFFHILIRMIFMYASGL